MTYNALQQGAVGVDMGRNIWQNDYPVAMIRAIRSIVHEGLKPKQAHEIFRDEKEKESKKLASA
jgi:putative autoinducer-2 (AI-2) aldolase